MAGDSRFRPTNPRVGRRRRYVSAGRKADRHGSIVIEILSPGTRKRDETVRRRLFDREGVREHWLVDPDRDRVAVYRHATDGSFPLVVTLDAVENDTLTTLLLPGWNLPLDRLFR